MRTSLIFFEELENGDYFLFYNGRQQYRFDYFVGRFAYYTSTSSGRSYKTPYSSTNKVRLIIDN